VAPGTFGSAAGVLLFLLLSRLTPALYLVSVVGVIALGVWAAEEAERAFERKDDGRIVIDEVAGQLLTLAPLVFTGDTRSLAWLVTGFVTFRVLDVWKPGPARWAERSLAGGAGVVLDDVVAGAFGAAVLAGLGVVVS
jgi:phosphatidylglycerophosphatase A